MSVTRIHIFLNEICVTVFNHKTAAKKIGYFLILSTLSETLALYKSFTYLLTYLMRIHCHCTVHTMHARVPLF